MARGGNGRERSKRRAVKRGKWDEKETFPFATAQSRMCIYSGHVLSSVQFCISSLLSLFWQGGRGIVTWGPKGRKSRQKIATDTGKIVKHFLKSEESCVWERNVVSGLFSFALVGWRQV